MDELKHLSREQPAFAHLAAVAQVSLHQPVQVGKGPRGQPHHQFQLRACGQFEQVVELNTIIIGMSGWNRGIDLQTQILDQMEFRPQIAADLKLMDARIFREEKMGLDQH